MLDGFIVKHCTTFPLMFHTRSVRTSGFARSGGSRHVCEQSSSRKDGPSNSFRLVNKLVWKPQDIKDSWSNSKELLAISVRYFDNRCAALSAPGHRQPCCRLSLAANWAQSGASPHLYQRAGHSLVPVRISVSERGTVWCQSASR